MTMGLCKHFVHAKCLHRPIVIINQQYTKGEINFLKKIVHMFDLLNSIRNTVIIRSFQVFPSEVGSLFIVFTLKCM